MFDFNYTPPIFTDAFAHISMPNAIVPYVESRAYWDNQTVEVQLQALDDSVLDWHKYKLYWELNPGNGVEGIDRVTTYASPQVGYSRIPMPRVQRMQWLPLTLRLIDTDGVELTNHRNELLVVPSTTAQARFRGEIAVMTLMGREAAILHQLNYTVSHTISPCTQVVVTDSLTDEILHWANVGGKLLYVSECGNSVFWPHSCGQISEGEWITSSGWLRPDVYPNLQVDKPLSSPFQQIMPNGAIRGLPQEDVAVRRDFLAGRVSGWAQRSSIHTVQFSYGRGVVIMTTYALLKSLRFGDLDPVGVVMLNDLVDYLVSESCKPTLHIDA